MTMVRLLVNLPAPLKAKLDSLRSQGYTASGYIRALLERELNQPHNQERKVKDGRYEKKRPRIGEKENRSGQAGVVGSTPS